MYAYWSSEAEKRKKKYSRDFWLLNFHCFDTESSSKYSHRAVRICMSTLKNLQTYSCHSLWMPPVTHNLFHESFYSFEIGEVTCHSCTQNLKGKSTKRLHFKEYPFMCITQKCLWTAALTQKRQYHVVEALSLLTWSNFLQFFSAPFALPHNSFCRKACWLCLVLHLLITSGINCLMW